MDSELSLPNVIEKFMSSTVCLENMALSFVCGVVDEFNKSYGMDLAMKRCFP